MRNIKLSLLVFCMALVLLNCMAWPAEKNGDDQTVALSINHGFRDMIRTIDSGATCHYAASFLGRCATGGADYCRAGCAYHSCPFLSCADLPDGRYNCTCSEN